MPVPFKNGSNQQKKEEEFNKVLDRCYQKIYNHCVFNYGLDIQTAEDCTQEVFEIFYKQMDRLKDLDKIDSWLYKTADNLSKQAKRKISKDIKQLKFVDESGEDIIDNQIW